MDLNKEERMSKMGDVLKVIRDEGVEPLGWYWTGTHTLEIVFHSQEEYRRAQTIIVSSESTQGDHVPCTLGYVSVMHIEVKYALLFIF